MLDKTFHIRFSKEQLARLKRDAEEKGFSNIASFIRYKALDNSIERKLDRLMRRK